MSPGERQDGAHSAHRFEVVWQEPGARATRRSAWQGLGKLCDDAPAAVGALAGLAVERLGTAILERNRLVERAAALATGSGLGVGDRRHGAAIARLRIAPAPYATDRRAHRLVEAILIEDAVAIGESRAQFGASDHGRLRCRRRRAGRSRRGSCWRSGCSRLFGILRAAKHSQAHC